MLNFYNTNNDLKEVFEDKSMEGSLNEIRELINKLSSLI